MRNFRVINSLINFQLLLIILCRVLAMVETAPLFSSNAIPQIAKIGFSLFVSIVIFPWVNSQGYTMPGNVVDFFLLVIGEVFLGILLGFFLQIIFAAFQVAGQFFSLQMGFGASQVFDPLAQIQIPLMGQFLNIMAMFVFLNIAGFQKFMLIGIYRSFQAVKAIDLVTNTNYLLSLFIRSLGGLFENAMTIAFPILGTLLLVSVTMGLLAKAAPQMNLLMMGFPIAIGTAFAVLIMAMPFIVSAFIRIMETGFENIADILNNMQGGGG